MASYRNKRGIFGLRDVSKRQRFGAWTVKNEVWLPPSPFTEQITQYDTAYLAGGYSLSAGARVSTVVRYDFSNDTADTVSVAQLPNPKSTGAENQALGNQSYGYAMGGSADPGLADSIVVRIDYSNDSSAPAPGAQTWIRLLGSAGASNTNYGYLFGGIAPTTKKISIICI